MKRGFFLDQTQKDLPLNPVLRVEWRKIVEQLQGIVNQRQSG